MKNTKRSFAQSIVLYGQDIVAQYCIALDIARQLNCLNETDKGNATCECRNCNWIRNNQHPAILTISKNDNKPSDDTSTKVISIKQTHMVSNSLVNSSEYYRVFIFCDSQVGNISERQEKNLAQFSELNFKMPQEDWYPLPLDKNVLAEAPANSLLKIVEEPPERTLFIFLTKDKEDIIETIISRSQCFYIPSFNQNDYDIEIFDDILKNYPQMKKIEIISLTDKLMAKIEEKNYENDYVLDCLEYYFVQMLKNNLENKILVQKIKKDILKVQQAKKQSNAYIRARLIFENLLFSLLDN